MSALAHIAPDAPQSWEDAPEALALLAKIDAFERASDYWSYDCPEAAKAFGEAADDAECALDNLRCDALHDVMTASCNEPYGSEAYFLTQEAADETLTTVQDAIQSARRNQHGSDILRNES